ncbi:G patch domain-containing protein 2-like [Styela clava]
MDELVQDLVSALDDSSLWKEEIDEQGDMSAASSAIDRELYRKRRTRKRRTASTSSHLVSSILNNLVVVNQIHSPRSSSSLDEAVKDYVESFTANCSDESDSYTNVWNTKLKNVVLSSGLQDRVHHKRVFKQATPCNCESDSHTENGITIPVLRKHRKKKLKRMTVDSSLPGLLRSSPGSNSASCNDNHKNKQLSKSIPHPSGEETHKMSCKTTKLKKEQKTAITCLVCYQKSCDKLFHNHTQDKNGLCLTNSGNDKVMQCDKANLKADEVVSCQCDCHANLNKDESSISSTSSNSDTDSANFTQDDVGVDGDDEMTDFYAETDGGPVWGIPNLCGMRCPSWSSKDESMWAHQAEDAGIPGGPYVFDEKIKRFVTGSMHISEYSRRGFHARNNRLPGMAARSVRRGRRRAKVKKAKEKRDMDFRASLSKLSLSERSKRIKLDEIKETFYSHQDWSSNKFMPSVPTPQGTSTENIENGINIEGSESQNVEKATGSSHMLNEP